MKTDIVLAGVGGQGILTIAAMIAKAALESGLQAKQSEVHGMAQRGGAVESHLRLSSETIFSDIIARGHADIICGVEPLEALRQIAFLSPQGWIVTSADPVASIPDYPAIELILSELRAQKNVVLVPAIAMAKDAGSPRAMNMVISGAASALIPDIKADTFLAVIAGFFSAKGQAIVDMNQKAFTAGRDLALTETRRVAAAPGAGAR